MHCCSELAGTTNRRSRFESSNGKLRKLPTRAIAKDMRLGNGFKIVEVEGLRIKRQFLIASSSGPEAQGLAVEFRRFVTARAGLQGASTKSTRNGTAGANKISK